ncbi:MAG: glycoside hydrolase family 10 protein [Victivallaceae bacterium]|nr:family 10 glycosylhydrolase [Victivallaceae bacterium]
MKKLSLLMAVAAMFAASAADQSNMVVLKNYKTGQAIPYGGSQQGGSIMVPRDIISRAPMFRGVWVATVENIDFPKHGNRADFERDYLDVVNTLRKLNFNAMIFQIRANNDAFYPSVLNPWSRWLSGTEGVGIAGFDPLRFMVTEAHKRGLEYHAWLNPYRVTSSTPKRKAEYLKTLAPNNFARRHPELVLEIPMKDNQYQLILNPGEPQVINFVVATVQEIIRNYDVDAIHFDDYFYPYAGIGSIDASTFRKYGAGISNIDDWRRNNVDTLIYNVHNAIDAYNRRTGKRVQFGISPFGIWANRKDVPGGSLTSGSQSYSKQFADTRKWVKRQWLDYIVPQVYWTFGRDVAPYAAIVDWWCSQVRGTGVKLYVGLGAYQLGGSNEQWRNPDEIAAQMRFNSSRGQVSGDVFFSYRNIVRPSNEIMRTGLRRVIERYWQLRVPAPVPVRR